MPRLTLCGIGTLVYTLHKNVKMKMFGSWLFDIQVKMSYVVDIHEKSHDSSLNICSICLKIKSYYVNGRNRENHILCTVVQNGQSSSLKCPGRRLCGIGSLVYTLHKNVKMKMFGSRLFATEGKMSFSQGILTGKSNFSIINEKNL